MGPVYSFPALGVGYDNTTIAAQTKRFTAFMPNKHTPSYSQIKTDVEKTWQNPGWGTVKTMGALAWSKITNGISGLFGKPPQHKVSVLPGGHTYNVDTPVGVLHEQFDQIRKVSEFERNLLVHRETLTLWAKMWIGKIMQFFSPPEAAPKTDPPA